MVSILKAYCWKCHGGEGRVAELDARTLPLLMKGGKSGPALKKGASSESLLFQKLSSGKMPPDGSLRPTPEHIELIRRWIDAGSPADYEEVPSGIRDPIGEDLRSAWAFRPPVRPAVPHLKDPRRANTAVDAFLLAKLDTAGLDFAKPAGRLTLIRRLSFDLIGLPPAPAEVDAFLADADPDEVAIPRLVDRLLASPHYGERWGRHWLDAAGYVDVIASDNDASIIEEREGIWRYRDWVVRTLNADKPYDQFLREQLAGDELFDWRNATHYTPEMLDLLTATGFLRLASDVTYAPELNTADIRNQVLYDTVQIVSTNLLGLTVHCCQCHDHKFDPLPQTDYYRLAAAFAPAYDVQNWMHSKDRHLYDVPPSRKQAIDANNQKIDQEIVELKAQELQVRQPFLDAAFAKKLDTIPEPVRADLRTALATLAEKQTEVQKYLAAKLGSAVSVSDAEVDALLDEPARAKVTAFRSRMAELPRGKQSYGKIQGLWDLGPPPPSFVFRRGDYATPGQSVRAGAIEVLCPPGQPLDFPMPSSGRPTSGSRTALADWLTRTDHPLTARVIVNRVWQQYFGRGIVATPDNFGASGSPPTHPELLDHLAVEFMAHGWSLKWLHRHIVLSAAYQQASSRETPAQASADPDNTLLWKMPVRRLESEIVRDALLAASGALDPSAGGPPVPLKPNPDGSVEIDTAKCPTPTSRFRRSLYVFCRRNYQLSELAVFDQPAVAHNCTSRASSAVVQQSLSMLNGKFALEMAERLAQRVAAEDATTERAFRLALCRGPSDEERTLCEAHLARQRQRYIDEQKLSATEAAKFAMVDLCQMLLNTNEFLYVE